jgi:phosphatidylglycerol---prolipoprotein diacylglyceryl transferase
MLVREGIIIGPLFIHFYGVIIMIGAVAAAWLAGREMQRSGQSSDVIWDILPWVLIGGIIGARLWHILTPPASMVSQGITTWYYLTHPLDALAIWRGGLGIPGAVLGGALALYIYVRRHQLNFGLLVDAIAPGLALAQAVGRWGNFVNQELYGAPSNLPWAIYIEPLRRLPGFENIAYYHPLFLYESIYNLINMGILLWIARKVGDQLKKGDIFLIYLIIYPIGRFLLEFLRLDPSPLGGVNVNQTLMALIAICASIAFFLRHRNTDLEAPEEIYGEEPDVEESDPEQSELEETEQDQQAKDETSA